MDPRIWVAQRGRRPSQPFEEFRQWDFLERLEDEIRILERKGSGDRIRDGNAEEPGRFGCASTPNGSPSGCAWR